VVVAVDDLEEAKVLDPAVHVWCNTDPEVTRHLHFRDQLRRSPEDRQAYERLKRELARREWSDMNDYVDAKGPMIEDILARANGRPSHENGNPARAAPGVPREALEPPRS